MATVLDNTVNASPTKEFFITMSVRDIELVDAVADLVDNCVDGARRIRPAGNFTGLWVRIEVSNRHFRIADNCGGISVDIARNYAFRFGRPKEFKPSKHSIGQFGIGMKRALFKIGKEFVVDSSTASSRFVLTVNVEANFDNRLRAQLANSHQESIRRGLAISINGIPLQYQPAELL
jgi:DNA topoisomerase VI subunit B